MNAKGTRTKINLSVDPEVWEKAKEIIHGKGGSASDYVSNVLKDLIEETEAEKRAAKKKKA